MFQNQNVWKDECEFLKLCRVQEMDTKVMLNPEIETE